MVDAELFEVTWRNPPAPNLRPRLVMLIDNLSAHMSDKDRELIENAGCELLYLVPYSALLNPIEEWGTVYVKETAG